MNLLAKSILCFIAAIPAAQASTVILGVNTGDTPGTDAIDIQSFEDGSSQIAAGSKSIAIGTSNIISSSASLSVSIGTNNAVSGAESGAFGLDNIVSAANAMVFGEDITNSIANSIMIGLSNADKVTILSSGYMGIGLGATATPVQMLDVGGSIQLSGNIVKAGGGTVVLPTSGTLTLPAAGGSLVTTSGTQTITGTTTLGGSSTAQQVKIDGTTGNVGIGATSPSAAKLQVAGDSIFGVAGTGQGTNSVTFRADSASANVDLFSLNFQRSNYSPTGTAAAIVFGRESGSSEGYLSLKTNDGSSLAERLRVTSDGRVGVGTLPNATAKMHVSAINTQTTAIPLTGLRTEAYVAANGASNSSAMGLVAQGIFGSWGAGNNSGSSSGVTGVTGVGRNDSSQYGVESATGVSGQIWLLPSGGTASSFITNGKALSAASPYFTNGCSVTNAYALYLSQQKVTGVTNGYGVYQLGNSDINYFEGKVGVGTFAPSVKFEVSGDAKISGALTVGGAAVLTATGNGSGLTGLNATQLTTGTLSTDRLPSDAVKLASAQTLTNKTLSDAKFTGNTVLGAAGSNQAQQVFISSNGNLGIGTNSPATRLDVNGEAIFRDGVSFVNGFYSSAAFIDYNAAGTLEQIGASDLWLGGGTTLSLGATTTINLQTETVRLGVNEVRAEIKTNGDGATLQNITLKPYGTGSTIVDGKTKLNGATEIAGTVTLKNVGSTKSAILISPVGDIDMGEFAAGTNPNPTP